MPLVAKRAVPLHSISRRRSGGVPRPMNARGGSDSRGTCSDDRGGRLGGVSGGGGMYT